MDEPLLEQLQEEASFDSTGVFTLRADEARAKLARYALARPELATLKLAQAYHRLGCDRLSIEVHPKHWIFRGRGGGALEWETLRSQLLETSLQSGRAAHQEMARALVGMSGWPLQGVRWQGETLFGEAPSDARGLVIAFAEAPQFPTDLWRERLIYTPMEIELHGLQLSGHLKPLPTPGLEVFYRHPEGGDFLLRSGTREPVRLLANGPDWVREAPQKSVPGAMILRWDLALKRPSRFVPVQAGLLLDPLIVQGFPDGIEVIFSAEGLATDLGSLRLLQDQALQQHLAQVLGQIPASFEALSPAYEKKLVGEREGFTYSISPTMAAGFGLSELAILLSGQLGAAALLALLAWFGDSLMRMNERSHVEVQQKREQGRRDQLLRFTGSAQGMACLKSFQVKFPD
jgi:hypothetical protein